MEREEAQFQSTFIQATSTNIRALGEVSTEACCCGEEETDRMSRINKMNPVNRKILSLLYRFVVDFICDGTENQSDLGVRNLRRTKLDLDIEVLIG